MLITAHWHAVAREKDRISARWCSPAKGAWLFCHFECKFYWAYPGLFHSAPYIWVWTVHEIAKGSAGVENTLTPRQGVADALPQAQWTTEASCLVGVRTDNICERAVHRLRSSLAKKGSEQGLNLFPVLGMSRPSQRVLLFPISESS